MIYQSWTAHAIKQHILSKDGIEPLNSHYYAVNYPDVYAAAERMFGGWQYAIESCGLDYEKIRKYKRWSKEKVLDEIKRLKAEKHSLNSKTIQQTQRPLYLAALRRFKSWGNALEAAGLNYKKIRKRRRMTEDDIRKEIQALAKKGTDLSYANMRSNHLYLLANAMRKIGNGSWVASLKSCGIKYRRTRRPQTADKASA
ncbi:MAG: hypothetical protein GX927_00205 [Lentisphaerae bacterium]|nr:hypothetical protein [Lentisphaerota bacterium]